jgi:hypothetical protein
MTATVMTGERQEDDEDSPPGQAAQDPFHEEDGLEKGLRDRLEDEPVVHHQRLNEIVDGATDGDMEGFGKHR